MIKRGIVWGIVVLLFSGVVSANEYITNMAGVNSCTPDGNEGTVEWGIVENPLYGGFGCDRLVYIDLMYDNKTLRLNIYQLSSEGYSSNISIHETGAFDENTITYNTKPATGELIYSAGSISGEQWVYYDITGVQYIVIIPASYSYEITTAYYTDDSGTPPYITYFYIPPSPTSLAETNDSASYVNWTWQAGIGNVTDSFNVSVNGSWINGSANLFYNHTNITYSSWSNISVFAYNSSAAGTLNQTPVTGSAQLPLTTTYDSSGYVKDESGKLLAGVNVTYGSTTVWSNTTGWYDFGNSFADGTYTYSVKHGFYTAQTGTITTTQGESIKNYTLSSRCSINCTMYSAKNGSDDNTGLDWGNATFNVSTGANYTGDFGTLHIGYGNYSNQTKINGTRSLRYFCDVAGYQEPSFGSKCRFSPFGR